VFHKSLNFMCTPYKLMLSKNIDNSNWYICISDVMETSISYFNVNIRSVYR